MDIEALYAEVTRDDDGLRIKWMDEYDSMIISMSMDEGFAAKLARAMLEQLGERENEGKPALAD